MMLFAIALYLSGESNSEFIRSLYQRCHRLMRWQIVQIIGTSNAASCAEDLLQEAALRLIRNASTIRNRCPEPEQQKAYAMLTAKSVAINEYNRRKKQSKLCYYPEEPETLTDSVDEAKSEMEELHMKQAAKRANGEGTIYKRADGVWICQISANDRHGEPVRKSFTGKTRQEVINKRGAYEETESNISRLRAQLNSNGSDIDYNISLTAWVFHWIELYKKPPNIKETTYSSYRTMWKDHVKPFFGNTPLVNISDDDMQKFYNYLSESGRIDGKEGGLSPKSIRNIHNMLRSSLNKAVGRIITRNPCSDTTRPSVPIPDMRVLTEEEMLVFLAEVNQLERPAYIYAALFTGIRMGELLALTWDDVDFQKE